MAYLRTCVCARKTEVYAQWKLASHRLNTTSIAERLEVRSFNEAGAYRMLHFVCSISQFSSWTDTSKIHNEFATQALYSQPSKIVSS